MRDRRLQGIEAIVERQERVPAEGDEDRLLLDREHRGFRFTRAGWQIGDGAALLPFGDGLRVDAVAQGQRPQARLTMLYRSTDRLCRCGAAVENLAHSASLHAGENGAPSKLGIKHLAHEYGGITGGRRIGEGFGHWWGQQR
jgi:hypothetical protein